MPRSTLCCAILSTVFPPSRCPSALGRCFFLAHRPLPSIIMAIWRGIRAGDMPRRSAVSFCFCLKCSSISYSNANRRTRTFSAKIRTAGKTLSKNCLTSRRPDTDNRDWFADHFLDKTDKVLGIQRQLVKVINAGDVLVPARY